MNISTHTHSTFQYKNISTHKRTHTVLFNIKLLANTQTPRKILYTNINTLKVHFNIQILTHTHTTLQHTNISTHTHTVH